MRGRKSKYDDYVKPRLTEIEGWCREGLIEEEIAKKLGISVTTLNEYKKKHPQFLESLRKGKEVVDYEVEKALFNRAKGIEYTEVTEERAKNGKMVVTKRVTKYIPPSEAACIIWLKNRKPDQWRDRPNGYNGNNHDQLDDLANVLKESAKKYGVE